MSPYMKYILIIICLTKHTLARVRIVKIFEESSAHKTFNCYRSMRTIQTGIFILHGTAKKDAVHL